MDHAYLEVIKAIQEGVNLSPLITRHIKFEECGEFMMKLLDSENKNDIKVIVDFE
jgi:threonine dehydrogenase-like Zn-dependent dehydrogenase